MYAAVVTDLVRVSRFASHISNPPTFTPAKAGAHPPADRLGTMEMNWRDLRMGPGLRRGDILFLGKHAGQRSRV
jgi:hypothetical protein